MNVKTILEDLGPEHAFDNCLTCEEEEQLDAEMTDWSLYPDDWDDELPF